MSSQKKILIVLTSANKLLTGEPTGWYLPELAHPYYVLKDDFALTIASPQGGEAPLDPKSVKLFGEDEGCKRFLNDEEAQKIVKNTVKLSSVNPSDFDAIFYVGGHGPVIDLAYDETSFKLIENFYTSNKITSAVCHAPSVFANVKINGEPIVKGKKFTGFSNTEEKSGGTLDGIPFLLEDELQKAGGQYERTEDWQPKVVVDGKLYTGQNPASAGPLAERIKKDLLA